MRCQDLMRRPVQYVHPHDAVQAAARIMREANVGLVPVCDTELHVLGVVTDRDITVRLVAENRDAAATEVAAVMSRDPISCRSTDEIGYAQALMREHKKSRVVVTDAQGDLVGIISLSDLAHHSGAEAASILRSVAERELLTESGVRTR
jgi:CBS domain-containing protein